MDIRVRDAGRRDLEHVAKVFEKSFDGSYRYWSLRLLNVLEVLVAEVDGVIVGGLEHYVTVVEGYGRVGVIGFIAVEPSYRKKGVGSRLVQTAESRFLQRKCRYSAASTKKGNTASINLFTKLGYAIHERGSEVFEDFEEPLYAYEDDVILIKRLEGV